MQCQAGQELKINQLGQRLVGASRGGQTGKEPGLVTAVAIVLGGAGGATDSYLNPQRLWEEEVSPGSDLWAAPASATAPPSGWPLVSSGSFFGFLGHKTA